MEYCKGKSNVISDTLSTTVHEVGDNGDSLEILYISVEKDFYRVLNGSAK